MKRIFPVLLLVVVIALLCGTIFLLQKEPAPIEEPTVQTAATPLPLTVLIDQQEQPAVEVCLEQDDQTVTYVYDAQSQVYKAKGYDDRLLFDQTMLGNLFGSCNRLVSRKVIDAAPEDLSVYGLDAPVCTVSALYADGQRHVLRIGAHSPLNDGYYGLLDDEPAVQLLLSYDTELFQKTLKDYRSYSLFHSLGDDAEAYSLTVRELLIDRGEAGRLSIYREPDSANGDVHDIQIIEPVTVGGNEYDFSQKVITPLLSLSNAKLELVEDLPQDMAAYGLDAPRILYIRDDAGKTRLLIGKEENGRTYLMREAVPAVMSVKTSALRFLELDYAQIMDRLVWLYNIDRVQSLTIQRGSQKHVLEVQNGGKSFLLNGTAVDTEAGRGVYRAAISLQYTDRAERDEAMHTAECTLTLLMRDGQTASLALYALNERHLGVELDGEWSGFYISKSGLQAIDDALEKALP